MPSGERDGSALAAAAEREARIEEKEIAKPKFEVGGFSEANWMHPDHNDDSFVADAAAGLLAVADGTSTSPKGGELSRRITNFLREHGRSVATDENGNPITDPETVDRRLQRLMLDIARQADAFVADEGNGYTATKSAATLTVTQFVEMPGGWEAVSAAVGDSQDFVIEPDGTISRVELRNPGFLDQAQDPKVTPAEFLISREDADLIESVVNIDDLFNTLRQQGRLTTEQQEMILQWIQKNKGEDPGQNRADVLRLLAQNSDAAIRTTAAVIYSFYQYLRKRSELQESFGGKPANDLKIVTNRREIRPGSIYLKASDGLGNLTPDQIATVLRGPGSLDERMKHLNMLAGKTSRLNNGKWTEENVRVAADDITVQAFEFPGERDALPAETVERLERERKELAEESRGWDEAARQRLERIKYKEEKMKRELYLTMMKNNGFTTKDLDLVQRQFKHIGSDHLDNWDAHTWDLVGHLIASGQKPLRLWATEKEIADLSLPDSFRNPEAEAAAAAREAAPASVEAPPAPSGKVGFWGRVSGWLGR